MTEEVPDEVPLLRVELEKLLREQEHERHYTRYLAARRARQRRTHALLSLGVATLASFLIFFFVPTTSFQSSVLRVATFALPALALGVAALAYLQPTGSGIELSAVDDNYARLRYYLDERLSTLASKGAVGAPAAAEFTDADKSKILAGIQAKLESEALQSYAEGIRELVTARVREDNTEQLFSSISSRLGREVQDLARRGNLNLILGILTTLVGLSVLGYSVFYSPISHVPEELFAYFVPRVSLVILIEVFAYFFLKLYKQSLAEIKYFQNEITNIESKQLAIQLAMRTEDPSLRIRVVEELAKTERNFILGKDQTTVDLERERLSRSTYADVATAIKDLLKKRSDA